eukprot:scaffold435_cov107-Cylindrotheca_fusiformis.AAC.4
MQICDFMSVVTNFDEGELEEKNTRKAMSKLVLSNNSERSARYMEFIAKNSGTATTNARVTNKKKCR